MEQITIGRNSISNIVVPAQYTTVSGNHATISLENGVYTLEDHSTNGSYINGTRIHNASCNITSRDNITLGKQYILNFSDVQNLLGLETKPSQHAPSQKTARYTPPAQPINQQINVNVVAPQDNNVNVREEPACLHRWNWGAFWFCWLWGVCNKVYWPLITLIPYVGQLASLIIIFILGANGSRYAWEKFQGSASEFDEKQHSWAVAAGICFLITIIITIVVTILVFTAFSSSINF